MSKLDAVRAMREARYAETQARAGSGATPASPRVRKPTPKPAVATPGVGTGDDTRDGTGDDGLCGHRNISGRTCTRERGHAAKTHRYS